MFSKEILNRNKIPKQTLKKKEVLFREQEKALYLYYLLEGEVQIHNTDSEGKEFLIEKVAPNNFLGEPPFLLEERYPATAVIMSEKAEVYRFDRERFDRFAEENKGFLMDFVTQIAKKAYNKTMKMKAIVHQNPQERVINFLKNYKRSLGVEECEKTVVDITRKEMASSTGLAIETVIRTVKKMEKDGKVELINHKIYF